MHAGIFESCFNFIAFVFTHQAMVNEDTSQLVTNSFRNKSCCNGAIYTAGQGQQYFAIAYSVADFFNSSFCIVRHCPCACETTYFIQEVVKHFFTTFSMQNFCMVLHSVQFTFFILHRCNRAVFCMRNDFKPFRYFCYIVNVGHPHNLVFVQAFEQWGCSVHFSRCFTKLTVVRRFNFATQCMRHKLHTIAHAKNRNTKFKDFLFNFRGIFFVHAVRATSEDDTLRLQFLNFF